MTSSSPRTEILHCVQNDRVKGPSHDQCCLDFFPPDTHHPGSVSQPIGKPFNGQAKGLLWLTWRSYAGPPQYYITPEGGALNPPVRRSRLQAEPWQPRAERPGGWLNPHARKGVSTFGNTGKHRAGPDPDRAERRLNPQARQGLSITGLPFCVIFLLHM